MDVHGRGHEQGFCGRQGEQGRGQGVVGDAASELGDGVGRGRHDKRCIGPFGRRDMRDGVAGLVAGRKEAGQDAVMCKRLEGRRAHKGRGLGGHRDADVAARLLEAAHDLAGLVGRDAAGHGDEDMRCGHVRLGGVSLSLSRSDPDPLLGHQNSLVTRMRWQ